MQRIGDIAELKAAGRTTVRLADRTATVFFVEGQWYAYENRCPHAGGPVCQGRILPRVRTDIEAGGRVSEPYFSRDEFNLVCPWHGWEFDLRSGQSVTDSRRRLRKIPVEVRDDGLYSAG